MYGAFDAAKLIECVKKNPPIWDQTHPKLSDRAEREKLWLEIGECMFNKWHELPKEEKNLKVFELKKKWKNIRDAFRKEQTNDRKKNPSRKYIYADNLSFLPPVSEGTSASIIRRRFEREVEEIQNEDFNTTQDRRSNQIKDQSINGVQHENSNEFQNESSMRIQNEALNAIPNEGSYGIENENSNGISRENLDQIFISAVSSSDQNKKRRSSWSSEISSPPERNQRPKNEDTAPDTDKYFLLSLLPDFKALPEPQKLDFRIRVLHLLQEYQRYNPMLAALPAPTFQMTPCRPHFCLGSHQNSARVPYAVRNQNVKK